jgi:polyphosphate glucokinase
MKVLVLDIGGTTVKALATGKRRVRHFLSGPAMTPINMVAGVLAITRDWKFDVVSIGYPGPVVKGRPTREPYNLGPGWVGFDFEVAFQRPVKVINDAAMQAVGSYKDGKLLFLGLGTGLGSALVVEGKVHPMELGHLPYKDRTFEDYVGVHGLISSGVRQWRRDVADVVARLTAALLPDDVVIGGGNIHRLKVLPPGCRPGDNANAFLGGFRLWETNGKRKEDQRGKAARPPHTTIRRQTSGVEDARRASQKHPRYSSSTAVRG